MEPLFLKMLAEFTNHADVQLAQSLLLSESRPLEGELDEQGREELAEALSELAYPESAFAGAEPELWTTWELTDVCGDDDLSAGVEGPSRVMTLSGARRVWIHGHMLGLAPEEDPCWIYEGGQLRELKEPWKDMDVSDLEAEECIRALQRRFAP